MAINILDGFRIVLPILHFTEPPNTFTLKNLHVISSRNWQIDIQKAKAQGLTVVKIFRVDLSVTCGERQIYRCTSKIHNLA